MVQVRARHVGVHEHGDDEAAEGRLRERFGEHQVGQRIGLRAAMFAGIHQPEQAGIAHLAQHLARCEAVALPLFGERFDLPGDEARDLLAQLFVLVAEVDVVHRHPAHMRNTPNFASGIGAFRLALMASASTRRVSAGSITPSSHSRALA